MKKTKNIKKHSVRRWHKRIILHPASILLLLCAGVLVVMSTLPSNADSYVVTAKVAAPPVTTAPIITSYYDQEHIATSPITIVGTCPDQAAYVELYRDAILTGISNCSNNSFSITATLNPGANQFQVKAYNSTDDPGPSSPIITIFYDVINVTPQQPATTPTTLSIFMIDGVIYHPGMIIETSIFPTIAGYAPPGSTVVVTFHSSPQICSTRADKNGWWSCTTSKALVPGIHAVDIVATTPDGRVFTFPTIYILVKATTFSLLKQIPSEAPLVLSYTYQYQVPYEGEPWRWNMGLSGGIAPYTVGVDWKDGSTLPTQNVGNLFTLIHTFNHAGTYTPIVEAKDSSGRSTVFQLLVIVQSHGSLVGSSRSTVLGDIHAYLWFIWPAYIVILLMVVSFWLGEFEIVERTARKVRTRQKRRAHR